MTNLERLKLRTNEADEAILQDCLESAKNAILALRYPFGNWPMERVEVEVPPTTAIHPETGDEVILVPGYKRTKEVPALDSRYLDLQYRCALDLYNRIGAEGQTSHSENGISRVWGAEWISQELLNEVVPMVGVIS